MKAAMYEINGSPHEVVEIREQGSRSLLSAEIKVSLELSAINPADIFAIMGSYPLNTPFPRIGGSEGIGIVTEIGSNVTNIAVGDRVLIPILAGVPIWSEEINVDSRKVFVVPNEIKCDVTQLGMASVNPPSAYGMLTQFEQLKEGDWIIQNAANSAVGTCVIGIAKSMGVKTINIVRREEVIDSVKSIGGDIVLIDGPDLAKRLKAEYGKFRIKLGLDGVAGDSTHQLAQCMSNNSTLVSYGAMSMQKCVLGISQLIYKQIKLIGYWYYLWTQTTKIEEVWKLNQKSNKILFDGHINVNVHSIYPLSEIKTALQEVVKPKLNGKILISGPAFNGEN